MKTKVTIKDIEWTFFVIDDNFYEKIYGKDSHGITIKDDLAVYIKKSSLSKKLIIHELFHTYVSSCCVNSMTELHSSDMEEISAEIVEFHLDDIANHSKKIYNRLSRDLKKEAESKGK
jgi:hypothetical protein